MAEEEVFAAADVTEEEEVVCVGVVEPDGLA